MLFGDGVSQEVDALGEMGDTGLVPAESQSHPGEMVCDLVSERFGLWLSVGAFDHHYEVVRVADHPIGDETLLASPVRRAPSPEQLLLALVEEPIEAVESDVGEQGRDHATLGCADHGGLTVTGFGHYSCFEEGPAPLEHPLVGNPFSEPIGDEPVRNFVEAGADVALDHPVVTDRVLSEVNNLSDSVVGAPTGTEPIRLRPETGLED